VKRWILLGVVMPLVSMSKPMVFASHQILFMIAGHGTTVLCGYYQHHVEINE